VKVSDKNLDDAGYIKFREFLEQQCGIVLGNNKQYLVKSRLAPLMARFDVPSLAELVNRTLRPTERQLRAAVVDAMTTNETLWFRDKYPFELLKSKLLRDFSTLKRPVRIWSAACSSGQEPFSIAMIVDEFQRSNPGALPFGVNIVGTDISNTMLELCKNATYDSLSLSRGLPADRKQRYFDDVENGMSQVKENIRRMVTFRHLNLLDSYALMGKFDIIFCRNVLIYFSQEMKSNIIRNFYNSLNNKGYLLLGASESMSGLNSQFEMVRCNPGIVYQKP
jgi:chemotaxis protein methyltransferase CheR